MNNAKSHKNINRRLWYLAIAVVGFVISLAVVTLMYPTITESYKKVPIGTSNHAATLLENDIDTIEKLDLAGLGELDLVFLIGQAALIKNDTAQQMGGLKAYILYDKIGQELKERNLDGSMQPNSAVSRYLHTQLEQEQFEVHIYQPSNWDKLWMYTRNGEFGHIYNRVPRILIYALLASFFIAVIALCYWGYNKKTTEA